MQADGIRWLPRMIDKARMSADGTLGAYLIGHSPVDKALLKRLGLTTAQFCEIVAANGSDDAVLAALRARGFDESAVRRWSDRFDSDWAFYIKLWDVDEGYVPAGAMAPLLAAMRVVEGPLMSAFRKVASRP